MIRLLAAIVLVVASGHAAAAAIWWGLVHVPESNVAMLALSAALAAVCVALVGWVELMASLAWLQRGAFLERARRSAGALPWFLLAALLFAAIWWAVGELQASAAEARGQMDAAIMATTGITRTSWLHTAIAWTFWFVRYAIGLSLAITLMLASATGGIRAALGLGWLRRGLAPIQLLAVSLILLLFVVLPWQAVYWRPASLPPNWLEPAFVAAKLLALYVMIHVGWALVLGTVARRSVKDPAAST